MILHGDITMNGTEYKKGDYISPWKIFPFFLVHMLAFGGSGFFLAYFSNEPVLSLYAHGGIAITIYLVFYLIIFGRDEVKWMFINAGLGIFGLYSEIGALLSFAGKTIEDFPIYVHVIPFLYYVLYTFLLRQFILEITNSSGNEEKSQRISYVYAGVSLLIYIALYVFNHT